DAGVDDPVPERLVGAVAQDVLELGRVVRREEDLLLVEPAADAGVEMVRELEVVRDADDREAGVVELGVDLAQRVEDVVAAAGDQSVDLVEDEEEDASLRVQD